MKIKYLDKTRAYLFGEKPTILLMSGVHGDERTGVELLNTLVNELISRQLVCPVAIIPCANPEAYIANTRIHPRDSKDLNRIFPVIEEASPSDNLARSLQLFAETFETIIDIHVFTGQDSLMCGVDLNIGGLGVQEKVKEVMSSIGMEAICRIDRNSEPQKDGSLCAFLQSKGKLAFGVELSPLEIMQKEKIKNLAKNLLDFINGSLKPQEKKLITYIRHKHFSDKSGTFLPSKKPGNEIKKGEVVGFIKTSKGKYPISSPLTGILISLSYEKPVKEGEKLFVTGKRV